MGYAVVSRHRVEHSRPVPPGSSPSASRHLRASRAVTASLVENRRLQTTIVMSLRLGLRASLELKLINDAQAPHGGLRLNHGLPDFFVGSLSDAHVLIATYASLFRAIDSESRGLGTLVCTRKLLKLVDTRSGRWVPLRQLTKPARRRPQPRQKPFGTNRACDACDGWYRHHPSDEEYTGES